MAVPSYKSPAMKIACGSSFKIFVTMRRRKRPFRTCPRCRSLTRAALRTRHAAGKFASRTVQAHTDELGAFRCVPTHVNRQPAIACYIRRPGDDVFTALSLDVLRVADGEIAGITTFHAATAFPPLGLPPVLR